MVSWRPVDLLHLPGLGRLLRWRWGRLLFQIPLLLLALLVVYDGLTGPALASLNLATILVWVHYRGGVIVLLLLLGNLFCLGCPFALLRTIWRGLARRGRRWPRWLRHKWGAVALIFLLLWLYEWLDLWADPRATAWLVIGYFGAAALLEAVYAESPFCKYLCPLGAFNTLYASLSPSRIRSRNRDTCRTCPGKECVNGCRQVPGCGTELYVPQMASSLDCLLCLDCARACPYDNVAWAVRRHGAEFLSVTGEEVERPTGLSLWRPRWDLAFLMIMLAFAGLTNALGMVPPIYELEAALSEWLGVAHEGFLLLIIFGLGNLALPAGLGLAAGWLCRRLRGRREPLRHTVARYAPAFVPLGFSIWFGHYSFHFATGALTLIPVAQSFALDHGVAWLGRAPNWALGPLLPAAWLPGLQIGSVLIGFLGSLLVLNQAGRDEPARTGRRAALPWLVLLAALALAAVYLFTLPMEMRGTIDFGH